jgi:dihydroorotase
MNPPIRSSSDREALQKGLSTGAIDFVSTDHAPHEPEKKTENFKDAAFGTTGLETALRTLLQLHGMGLISPERVVMAFSSAPSSFIGLSKQYFDIKKGELFQGVIVEYKSRMFPVVKEELESLSGNNCFIGHKLPGKITRVYNRAGEFKFN